MLLNRSGTPPELAVTFGSLRNLCAEAIERENQLHDQLSGERFTPCPVRLLDDDALRAPTPHDRDTQLRERRSEAALSQLAHDLAEQLQRHTLAEPQRNTDL